MLSSCWCEVRRNIQKTVLAQIFTNVLIQHILYLYNCLCWCSLNKKEEEKEVGKGGKQRKKKKRKKKKNESSCEKKKSSPKYMENPYFPRFFFFVSFVLFVCFFWEHKNKTK